MRLPQGHLGEVHYELAQWHDVVCALQHFGVL